MKVGSANGVEWEGGRRQRMAPISSFSLFTTNPTSLLIMRLSGNANTARPASSTRPRRPRPVGRLAIHVGVADDPGGLKLKP